jgi:hypothetical protein
LKNFKNVEDLRANFETEILKWSLESVALVALGTRIGALEGNLPDNHPAKSLMYCSKSITDLSMKLEFSPDYWLKKKTPSFRKLMDIFDLQWE